MEHFFRYKSEDFSVELNPEGEVTLKKEGRVWGLGIWRCNYVLWSGERRGDPRLMDKVDGELRKIVPKRVPWMWQKDFYDSESEAEIGSTLSPTCSFGG